MKENPLIELESYGQSIWMDFIGRDSLENGQMQRWIQEDGVSGITSNPSIFKKAIVESHHYDQDINTLTRAGKSAREIYMALTVGDIQTACDLLRPTYDRKDGRDGFVSIEESPHLAHDTEGSIREARLLWKNVNRPNVMIKIPGTREGLPAIQACIGEGININITLLFGLPRYLEVVDAYF